MSTDVQMSTDE